jgi:hypothetical protein
MLEEVLVLQKKEQEAISPEVEEDTKESDYWKLQWTQL